MNNTIKNGILYFVMLLSLLFAVIIPLEAGFWGGIVRGVCTAVFIEAIPYWVRSSNEKHDRENM
jgi:hypothetical protein